MFPLYINSYFSHTPIGRSYPNSFTPIKYITFGTMIEYNLYFKDNKYPDVILTSILLFSSSLEIHMSACPWGSTASGHLVARTTIIPFSALKLSSVVKNVWKWFLLHIMYYFSMLLTIIFIQWLVLYISIFDWKTPFKFIIKTCVWRVRMFTFSTYKYIGK